MKTNGKHFLDLADLLLTSLCLGETKHKHFWMVKVVASAHKSLVVEVLDILTWTEAFLIYQMVCSTIILASRRTYHALNCWSFRWLLNTKLKHGLTNDLGFHKDAAASGLTGLSKMNIDLYNFHLRIPPALSTHQMTQTSVTTIIVGHGNQTSPFHFRLCSCSPCPASKGNKPWSPSAMICA